MKTSKKVILVFIILLVFLAIYAGIRLNSSDSEYNQCDHSELRLGDNTDSTDNYPENSVPWIEYLSDSTYKIVIDALITVYKINSGEKISTLSIPAWPIKSLDIHPSGSHLVVMGADSLHVYDLRKDDLANAGIQDSLQGDTTTVRPYDGASVVLRDQDEVHFSSDGKYFMTIWYRESQVNIYRWPDLEYLVTEYMGLYRNPFRWESRNGKMIFFYYEGQCIYRTEFPSDSTEEFPSFSEPSFVDSIRREETFSKYNEAGEGQ